MDNGTLRAKDNVREGQRPTIPVNGVLNTLKIKMVLFSTEVAIFRIPFSCD